MARVGLDDNKLSDVFTMLVNRLSNIEAILESIRESIKFNEIRRYGNINTSIFGWKLQLIRYNGRNYPLTDETDKAAPYRIKCACLSIDNLIGIDLKTIEYRSILESLEINLEKVHQIANENPKRALNFTACQDVGYDSHFDYIVYVIAQELVNQILIQESDWERALLDDFDGEKIWLWKKTPGTIEDFVNFYLKIMSALSLRKCHLIKLIDYPPNEAYFMYQLQKCHQMSELYQEVIIKELRNLQLIHHFSKEKLSQYPLFREVIEMLPEIVDFRWN